MKIDKDPTVVSDHHGHHLIDAKGKKVKTFRKDRAGLKQARMSLYKNFKSMDLPPIDPTKQEENIMSDLEKKLEEALNESITVNTMSNNDPNSEDTVTITATGEDAQDMLDMLKLAGVNQSADEQPETDPSMTDMIQIIPLDDVEEEVAEEFANTPNDASETEGDVDTMVNKISGGLNRQKKQYKKEYPGDNPMAVTESDEEEDLTERLLREYDEFKVTAPEDSDEGDWEIENVGKWAIKIGQANNEEASDEELGFDMELASALADEAIDEALADEDEDVVAEDDVEEGIKVVRKADSKCIRGHCDEEASDEDKLDALDKEMSEDVEATDDEEVVAEDETENVEESVNVDAIKKLAGI